jgi:hypothetical protein
MSEENTIGEKEDDSDEESFANLKENIEEENWLCKQLIEDCDKDLLVKLFVQRKEE